MCVRSNVPHLQTHPSGGPRDGVGWIEAGLADTFIELKRLERSTGVAKAAEIIEQAAAAALKKLQARFSLKSWTDDANATDSPTNAILDKVNRDVSVVDARCIQTALVNSCA